MAEVAHPPERLTIEDMPWPEIELPPTDLPYDDEDKIESPWHADTCALLKASVIAAHGGRRDDYYVASNMFVIYPSRKALGLAPRPFGPLIQGRTRSAG